MATQTNWSTRNKSKPNYIKVSLVILHVYNLPSMYPRPKQVWVQDMALAT